MKSFIPYKNIRSDKTLIVDGKHPKGLALSHWKGQNNLTDIADDTSAGVVLNAIEKNKDFIHFPYVSATHFDIDGFIGVWALYYPELAKKYISLLKEIALIGDFRQVNDFESEESKTALKIVAWLNAEEENLFYGPYGFISKNLNEFEECIAKFDYFLPRFHSVLINPNAYKEIWEKEYEKIFSDYQQIKNHSNTPFYQDLDLSLVETAKPLHYYPLFSANKNADIVVSIYDDNRYEVEFSYTTWVDIVSRPVFPRLDMEKLAKELNKIEKSNFTWNADKISDTGPILRLDDEKLNKEDRYQHPYKRNIFSSSIDKETFKTIVLDFFKNNLAKTQRKNFWTFDEMTALNKNL